jgi:uncharacterized membrane protein YkvA (DUF1232 family)
MLWFLRLRRLFSATGREALILWYAFRHPETPRTIKAASLLVLLYLVSPIDVLPDFVLLFGWADDLAVLMMGIPFLVNKLPSRVLAEASELADRKLGRFGRRAAGAAR